MATKDIYTVEIEPKAADMLFEDAAREWLDSLDDVKESSIRIYKQWFNSYIIPKIGNKKIADVMKIEAMRELETELNLEYTPASVANIFTIIRMVARSKLGDYSEIAKIKGTGFYPVLFSCKFWKYLILF